MTKKRLVLTFPPELLDQPITYHLIKDYELMVNILRANVTPDEEGRLVIEMSGEKSAIDKGIKYLSGLGVKIQPVAQDVKWYKERCDHCTACIPICPTGALEADDHYEKYAPLTASEELQAKLLPHLAKAEAAGRFRRLLPVDKIGWNTYFYQVHNKHPKWIIGKCPV